MIELDIQLVCILYHLILVEMSRGTQLALRTGLCTGRCHMSMQRGDAFVAASQQPSRFASRQSPRVSVPASSHSYYSGPEATTLQSNSHQPSQRSRRRRPYTTWTAHVHPSHAQLRSEAVSILTEILHQEGSHSAKRCLTWPGRDGSAPTDNSASTTSFRLLTTALCRAEFPCCNTTSKIMINYSNSPFLQLTSSLTSSTVSYENSSRCEAI